MVTAQSQRKPSNLRFSAFEVNFARQELFKNGIRVKIQKQPFEILCMLLERPGEVVSREQLREHLWPKNTFVEYEDSLNTAVRKLRSALSDSSDLPRYIETVARQGYRFVAPVQVASVAPEAGVDVDTGSEANRSSRSGLEGKNQSRIKIRVLVGMTLLLLLAAGVARMIWAHSRVARPNNGRVMLAVLPFQNLTGDASQEYFSDGLTEEMITQLGSLDPRHLGVIGRTSVMHYKGAATALDQISRELGVEYLLEGSVRRSDHALRIAAQLIHGRDQTHVWAREYDRELKDLLSVQREIAVEIADEIQLTLDDRKANSASRPVLSPQEFEAYDLYLKGQYFFDKRTVPGFEEAIGYFQQATAKDPKQARAYAGLADCYALMAGYSGRPSGEFMAQARAAALKALEIDESLPEAHAALGLIVQNYDWDWDTADREFRRAIKLNPNYPTAHHWYAEHLMWRGRFDEALAENERARQLDPLSLIIAADNGAIFLFSRQYDRAIDKWQSVLEMDPYFPRANLILVAYVEKGRYAEALSLVEKNRRMSPGGTPWWYWSSLAYIYGRSGQKEKARHALDQLLQSNRRSPIDPRIFAWNYAALGDKEQALAWLEKAYMEHSNELVTLKVNPGYDALRSDQRFQILLRRVGLDR